MSQITNNSRKSYHPDWDPPKTGDDLDVQWFFFFIVQINILFFSRVTLAICIQLSFTGFISVSCFCNFGLCMQAISIGNHMRPSTIKD